MTTNTISLSPEEVALALTQLGHPEFGRDVIVSQFGPLSPEEVRARVLSAGHSLIARELLAITPEGELRLVEPILRFAHVLAASDFSLHYRRVWSGIQFISTYHFHDGAIFEHKIERGIAHTLVELDSVEQVVRGGLDFFSMDGMQPFSCPSAEIPQSVLDEIAGLNDRAAMLNRLAMAGVAEETRHMLAADMQRTVSRGSMLRIEYLPGETPVANHGLLTLQGPERLWLLQPYEHEGHAYVRTIAANEQNFRREILALLDPHL